MSSKRNERRKQCIGKVPHDSIGEAIGHRKSLNKIGEFNLNAYRCKFCKKYHVGHKI